MVNILENIEKIRKEKNISQKVIAQEMGVKQPAYSNYITRNSDIYFNKLSQIADILDVRVIDIITYPKTFIDKDFIIDNTLSVEEKVTVQIELKKEKKDQVLKLIFGENNLEILNK